MLIVHYQNEYNEDITFKYVAIHAELQHQQPARLEFALGKLLSRNS